MSLKNGMGVKAAGVSWEEWVSIRKKNLSDPVETKGRPGVS